MYRLYVKSSGHLLTIPGHSHPIRSPFIAHFDKDKLYLIEHMLMNNSVKDYKIITSETEKIHIKRKKRLNKKFKRSGTSFNIGLVIKSM